MTESIVDVDNKVTAQELTHLLRLNLNALAADPRQASLLPPLMVWGAPGLGKSSILRQATVQAGIGFIDVRLAQREPVDIRGLPVPGPDGVKWLVASEWPRDPSSRGIILFDEITAADRSLQVAAYEFILDRRLGELYRVPDGWYICAAGNRTEDRAVAGTMSSALANRFLHVELVDDADSWHAWALGNDIRPEVIHFIRMRPSLLFHQEGENLTRGWPTPRAWERVSRMLDVMKGEEERMIRKMVYGLVGCGAGLEFMETMKMARQFEDVHRMMLDENAPVKIPEASDGRYALVTGMVYHLWRGEQRERLLDGFFRISMQLSSDFASLAMIDAISGPGGIDRGKRDLIYTHKSYQAWRKRHGAEMNKRIQL